MFTGIIEKQGKVLHLEQVSGSLKIQIASGYSDLALGESVAVNGVCLTVAELAPNSASFFISPETLEKSNLGKLTIGSTLNLERALTLQTRLSGHLVQGHVDGKGKFLEAKPDSEAYLLRFEIPKELGRFCVEKGSIAINGVSLTINSLIENSDGNSIIGITLIPHTWDHTNLSQLKSEELVNLEVDVFAKFAAKYVALYTEKVCRI